MIHENKIKSFFVFKILLKSEINDLLLLSYTLFLVLSTWIFALDWSPEKFIMGNDGPAYLTYLNDFIYHGGYWKNFLYSFDVTGGRAAYAAQGALPFFELSSFLNFSPITAMNSFIFFIQVCFGFFCTKASQHLFLLITKKDENKKETPFPLKIAIETGSLWIFCFAPFLSWRIFYGHWMILTGIFLFLSLFSMLCAVLAKKLTFTLMGVSILALINTFPSVAYQMILYSFIFGAPILLGLIWPKKGLQERDISKTISLLLPFLIVLASLFLIMPRVSGMIHYIFHSDSSRTLKMDIKGEGLTYNYTTQTITDWLSSIPWTQAWTPKERAPYLWHETNYPLGPLLLLLLLFPWKKFPNLKKTILLSLSLCLILSSRMRPLSHILLFLIPPLKAFRVPARSFLIFSSLLPIFAITGLKWRTHFSEKNLRITIRTLFILFCIGFSFLLQAEARELLAWVGVFFFLIQGKKFLFSQLEASILCVFLGIGSIHAFSERSLPYFNAQSLLEVPQTVRKTLTSIDSKLNHPLNRILLEFQIPPFSINTAGAMRLATVSGYTYPFSRFRNLACSLRNETPQDTQFSFDFHPTQPEFQILQELYHIINIAYFENNTLRLTPTGAATGAAWFSQKIVPFPSLQALSTALFKHRKNLPAFLHKEAYILENDPEVLKNMPFPSTQNCESAKVEEVIASYEKDGITLKVTAPALCPLTLSTNYFTQLKAEAFGKNAEKTRVPVFPIYGALTGILVPAGTTQLLITPELFLPAWSSIGQILGFMILGVLFIFCIYETKRTQKKGIM